MYSLMYSQLKTAVSRILAKIIAKSFCPFFWGTDLLLVLKLILRFGPVYQITTTTFGVNILEFRVNFNGFIVRYNEMIHYVSFLLLFFSHTALVE